MTGRGARRVRYSHWELDSSIGMLWKGGGWQGTAVEDQTVGAFVLDGMSLYPEPAAFDAIGVQLKPAMALAGVEWT